VFWAIGFITLVVIWAVAGIIGVVVGIRAKEWPRPARAATITLGLLAALPALYEMLIMVFTAVCQPNCP
jgi:ABC-type anion transport system duplicated permease subunit